MNRTRLERLLQALSQITRDRELVMIGSQAVHAVTHDTPDEVLISRECDVLFDPGDPLVAVIDEQLGRNSPYAAESRRATAQRASLVSTPPLGPHAGVTRPLRRVGVCPQPRGVFSAERPRAVDDAAG